LILSTASGQVIDQIEVRLRARREDPKVFRYRVEPLHQGTSLVERGRNPYPLPSRQGHVLAGEVALDVVAKAVGDLALDKGFFGKEV
jgi:hypothetical protein